MTRRITLQRFTLPRALKATFPPTIPIMAGFLFLGIAYGILMNISGFNAIYAVLMALLVFAGSMEFVAVHLLLGPFHPLGALFMTLMVNARHLFYGISMLEKYKGTGIKKFYLIFGLCDESFSINYTADISKEVDKGWYMFFVTRLNHAYWVIGAAIGGIFGSLVQMNMEVLVAIALSFHPCWDCFWFCPSFVANWTSTKKKELTHDAVRTNHYDRHGCIRDHVNPLYPVHPVSIRTTYT
ncbi:AzlC family ABC transporter permease [Paenibacillus massiliensis]|uniref:AzlC family ABC transporter permease n=1 Tax=Paenibacillus massiliensis TaxID=225917 RepID=UPI0003A538C5|nr:AzlC family ABC transporter permease [Paenibacillus massiliensis]